MPHIFQDRAGGNFYLRHKSKHGSFFRSLKTNSRAEAERALAKAVIEVQGKPFASGRIRWRPEDWQRFDAMPGQTRVAKQSYALAARALSILKPHGRRFDWLLSPFPRQTILADLGRLADTEILLLAADEICERKLTSKPALAFIRSLRGEHHAARPSTLADRIQRALRYHRNQHPETVPDEIARVLRAIALDVEKQKPQPAEVPAGAAGDFAPSS